MKIGILGGTFSPIHNGHIIMAEEAYSKCNLSRILFMPTGKPPHKDDVIDTRHRLAMVDLAIQDVPHFNCSSFEAERNGTIYTADTLTLLKSKNPHIEYTFILGADSFIDLERWYHPERIFSLAEIAVCSRDTNTLEEIKERKEYFVRTYGANVTMLSYPFIEISSQELRVHLMHPTPEGNDILESYVPRNVLAYIKKEGLYNDL